ncbi:hypothetical protein SEA_PHONEGINGI_53 [Microbacterium phage Phonegingi]|nr:hypothetical protein SEA_PHONEGINGI_53 [Microbacterium phage Phonegingi]
MRGKGWGYRVGQVLGVLSAIALLLVVLAAIVGLGVLIAEGIRALT